MNRKYNLADHPEHRAQLDGWAKRWIANAMSTEPANRPAMREAMAGLYGAAGLEPPPEHRGVFVGSPMTAAIAGTVAAGVWWLREHPDEHVSLFGRRVSDAEVMAAIGPACAVAVRAGMAALRGESATDDITRVETSAATAAATAAATDDATRRATSTEIWAATGAATRAATSAAVDAATDDATRRATLAATFAATRDATWAATRAATFAATGAAIRAEIFEATRAVTDAAIRDATWAATAAVTDAATWAATWAATDDAVVRFLLQCVPHWHRMHDGGSDWSDWPAYLSFFRHIAKLDLPEYERWRHYESAASNGASRIMHPKFWLAADRHSEVHVDSDHRLHCETGPARSWRDGWAVWAWHGVRVPKAVIDGTWSIDRILRERNAEVRRCAVEALAGRRGWAHVIEAAGWPEVGDPVPDPANPGQMLRLYKVDGVFEEPVTLLHCVNATPERDGTRREFGLTCPGHMRDPLEAAAWTFGLSRGEYAQLQHAY